MIAIDQPNGAPRLSCACLMILGNVEPTIRLCMDSVLSSGCFDEYVLVQDTRTRDATAAILEGYRAQNPNIRILWHDWKKQDYSAARNVGLRDASPNMQMIYWQDGDEVLLDPAGVHSLLQNTNRQAYHIWQQSPTPEGGYIQTHQLRLFPHLAGLEWELPVHEQVAFAIRNLGIPEHMTPYRVWHFGYDNHGINAEKHIERAKIMRDWLKRHPEKDQRRAYMQEQYQSSMAFIKNQKRSAGRWDLHWRTT